MGEEKSLYTGQFFVSPYDAEFLDAGGHYPVAELEEEAARGDNITFNGASTPGAAVDGGRLR